MLGTGRRGIGLAGMRVTEGRGRVLAFRLGLGLLWYLCIRCLAQTLDLFSNVYNIMLSII